MPTPARQKFLRDKQTGDKAENLVSDLFNGCSLATMPVDSFGPDRAFWDLETSIPPEWHPSILYFRTEVKYDIYEGQSNNVALEIQNTKSGLPSGLARTKAEFWCQVLVDSVWLAVTEELKDFVRKNKPVRIIKEAGDGNAKIYLYKTHLILPEVFHRLDHLKPKELRSKLKELWQTNFTPK